MNHFYTFACGTHRITGTLAGISAALPQWVETHTTPGTNVPYAAWRVLASTYRCPDNPKHFFLFKEPVSVLPRCIIRAAIADTLHVPQRQVSVTRIT